MLRRPWATAGSAGLRGVRGGASAGRPPGACRRRRRGRVRAPELVADRQYLIPEGRDEGIKRRPAEGRQRRSWPTVVVAARLGVAGDASAPRRARSRSPTPRLGARRRATRRRRRRADAARSERAAATRRGRRRRAPGAAAPQRRRRRSASPGSHPPSGPRGGTGGRSRPAPRRRPRPRRRRRARPTAPRMPRFVMPVDECMVVVALAREIGERRLEEGTCRRSCDLPGRAFRLVFCSWA